MGLTNRTVSLEEERYCEVIPVSCSINGCSKHLKNSRKLTNPNSEATESDFLVETTLIFGQKFCTITCLQTSEGTPLVSGPTSSYTDSLYGDFNPKSTFAGFSDMGPNH
ncbi:hypothetical protein OGAPHI_001917 [Ogataea philodendri]|uniref:Uncharacterized protein n=1 Tax=Ogataea philodendri TaxID=1378263 RepID=A0A9P8T6J6_9ASCO|nr:uncharacterized protein OGAPHI_001917 [Ogataea philodendri]KAH3668163.1 hypothetical protein OGAPHI_001917 [Ogataea philodendri]